MGIRAKALGATLQWACQIDLAEMTLPMQQTLRGKVFVEMAGEKMLTIGQCW